MNSDFRDLLSIFNARRVEFTEAWSQRIETRFTDQPVGVLSIEHMIRNKRAAGRAQDLADLEWLENPDKRNS